MPNRNTDGLDDTQLIAREAHDRDTYQQLEREQPQFRDTTYGLVRGSRELVDAWERWRITNLAARVRGLVSRSLGR